jgi:hypothetical protein
VYVGVDTCDDAFMRSCAPMSVVIGSSVDHSMSHLQSHDFGKGGVAADALIGVQVDTLIVGEHACDCQPPPLPLPKSLSAGLHHE